MEKTLAIIVAILLLSSCGSTKMLQNNLSALQTRIDTLEKANTELSATAAKQSAEIDSLVTVIGRTHEEFLKLSDQLASINAFMAFLTSRNPSSTLILPEDFDIPVLTGPATYAKPSANEMKYQAKNKETVQHPEKKAPVLDPKKCQATNKSGDQCQLPPVPGSKFCIQHQQF